MGKVSNIMALTESVYHQHFVGGYEDTDGYGDNVLPVIFEHLRQGRR